MYLYLFLRLLNTGAEIGEFLTPLIFLCHSYKKWTLGIGIVMKIILSLLNYLRFVLDLIMAHVVEFQIKMEHVTQLQSVNQRAGLIRGLVLRVMESVAHVSFYKSI